MLHHKVAGVTSVLLCGCQQHYYHLLLGQTTNYYSVDSIKLMAATLTALFE